MSDFFFFFVFFFSYLPGADPAPPSGFQAVCLG